MHINIINISRLQKWNFYQDLFCIGFTQRKARPVLVQDTLKYGLILP